MLIGRAGLPAALSTARSLVGRARDRSKAAVDTVESCSRGIVSRNNRPRKESARMGLPAWTSTSNSPLKVFLIKLQLRFFLAARQKLLLGLRSTKAFR